MVDIVNRLRQTRVDMLGTTDEAHYWDCVEAANEIEKLRAALKPFADEAEGFAPAWKDRPDPNEYAYPLYDKDDPPGFTIRDLRAAAAALKETGDE